MDNCENCPGNIGKGPFIMRGHSRVDDYKGAIKDFAKGLESCSVYQEHFGTGKGPQFKDNFEDWEDGEQLVRAYCIKYPSELMPDYSESVDE